MCSSQVTPNSRKLILVRLFGVLQRKIGDERGPLSKIEYNINNSVCRNIVESGATANLSACNQRLRDCQPNFVKVYFLHTLRTSSDSEPGAKKSMRMNAERSATSSAIF